MRGIVVYSLDMERNETTERNTMTAAQTTLPVAELAAQVEDLTQGIGETVSRVTMGECADGSRRWYALVETWSAGLEQTYRVITPAPWNSPEWASVHTDWTYEVRVGEGEWLALEV